MDKLRRLGTLGRRNAGRRDVSQRDVSVPGVLLLQWVWGPERVSEGWLVRDVVKRLRRELDDGAADPRYIFTEPPVGYRIAMGETVERVDGSTGLSIVKSPEQLE